MALHQRDPPHFSIPPALEDICFRLQSLGLTPIITHPERQPLIQERPERLGRLGRPGVPGPTDGQQPDGRLRTPDCQGFPAIGEERLHPPAGLRCP